jgi:uncharacterized membrane protein HdeD (DUF308 family)
MIDVMARNWGLVALRGLVAVVFGLLAIFDPGITLIALVYVYAAYAIVNGVAEVVSVIRNRRGEPHWVAVLLSGLVSIAAGVIAVLLPGITAILLVFLIAGWAIVTGVLEIVAAIRLRKVITGEWLLILTGVLSVVFGIFLAAFPGAGALGLVIWIGAYAIVIGIMLLALAFRLRQWGHSPTLGATPRPA